MVAFLHSLLTPRDGSRRQSWASSGRGTRWPSGPAPMTVTAVLGPVSDPQHTLF